MRRTLLALCLGVALPAASADAAPLTPFVDLQEAGLTLTGSATDGDLGSPSNLSVTIGGAVRFGLLYWTGANPCAAPCTFSQPYFDQQMIFNGASITGTVIGTEESAGDLNIGYFADVTSLVSAAGVGTHDFSIADGNGASNLAALDGFGLLVAYTNPNDTSFNRVQIFDNLEYLGAGDASNITFQHGAQTFGRTGELFLIGGNGTSAPSDYLTINGGSPISNPFSGAAGSRFDLYRRQINIAAGTAQTALTVGVAGCRAGAESLRWQVGALVTRNVAGSISEDTPAGPSCATVPEPTSLGLLGLAAAGFGVRGLRRRNY